MSAEWDYLRLMIFKDILEVLLACACISLCLSLALLYKFRTQEHKKRLMKSGFEQGYDAAMHIAEANITEFFEAWNSDDMFAYTPTKDNIITAMKGANKNEQG